MASPADGIRAVLANANPAFFGGATGWLCQVGELSASDNSIAILDTGGNPSEVRIQIEYPAIQILVRGKRGAGGYSAAYAKIEEIHAYLQGIPQNPVGMPRLTSCVAIGFINTLGRDQNDRPQFSVNFQLITTPVTAGNRTL